MSFKYRRRVASKSRRKCITATGAHPVRVRKIIILLCTTAAPHELGLAAAVVVREKRSAHLKRSVGRRRREVYAFYYAIYAQSWLADR